MHDLYHSCFKDKDFLFICRPKVFATHTVMLICCIYSFLAFLQSDETVALCAMFGVLLTDAAML